MSAPDSIVRHSLVSLLFGSEDRAAESASSVSRRLDWLRLVQLAEAWHVLPRLSERISEVRATPEPPARLALRRKSGIAFGRSMLIAQRGIEVLRLLEANGIPAAGFKGLASMATLYENPAL